MLKEQLVDYDPDSGRMRSTPRQVFLDLTSRCNLDCVTCSVDYGRDPPDYALGDMPLRTIERLRPWLDRALSVNLNIVGEPLIHPQFAEVLDSFQPETPNIHFNTNGLGLRPAMCERLVSRPVASVAVSVDGRETNLPVRGVTYESVRDRVATLLRTREEAGSRYPHVGIAYTLMRSNLHELRGILEDLLPLGLDMVHVQPLIVFYEFLADENPYMVEGVDDELARCEELCKQAGTRFTAFRSNFAGDERNQDLDADELQVGGVSRQFGCVDPFYEIKVRFNGQVLSCSYGLSGGLNVNELELDEIWNHEWYRKLRRNLHAHRFLGRCDGCPYIFGSVTAQNSAIRPGVHHSREERFLTSRKELR